MSSSTKPERPRSRRYPQELKDRAVRMVLDHEKDYDSRYAAITSIAAKLDIGPESLRLWVKNLTQPAAVASESLAELSAKNKELAKENRELKRANDILKAAATFFARELDPPQR